MRIFRLRLLFWALNIYRKKLFICQLLNFILGQAKLAVYISQKNKIEQRSSDDVYVCFLTLVKSRVLIDFQIYRTMKDLSTFEQIWCSHGALCVLSEDVLVFSL